MAECSLSKELMDNYTDILRNELIPAMGCTEPIAIAYAAAMARKILADEPEHITINCSGNMIKNVKGVKVPNSGGQRGIEVAATLGVVGGNPDKKLEVIAEVTDEDREKTRELVAQKFCDCNYVENVPNLYIQAIIRSKDHDAEVVIAEHHTDIALIKRDGQVLVEQGIKNEYSEAIHAGDRNLMSLKGLLDYANLVDLSEVQDILNRQIKMNSAISQEGLDNPWGASVGKTILENFGNNVKSCACACAAAGSDARMSGCPMPVVINSGSGNQGITVTMPVVVYARELSLSDEKRMRALIISNLACLIKYFPVEKSKILNSILYFSKSSRVNVFLNFSLWKIIFSLP